MNISLPDMKKIETDVNVNIIGRALEFFNSNNINVYNYQDKTMNSFDLNDILLLEGNHSVREKQSQSIDKVKCQYTKEQTDYIYQLHEKLYGVVNRCNKSYDISTTTAILINEILKGNIKNDTVVFYNTSREINGKKLFEIEIAIFDKKIDQIISFYANLINYILKQDISLRITPAFLSWASFSAKFTNVNIEGKRFGAFGYVNPEILKISSEVCNEHIAIIGLSFNTLCDII